MTIDIMLPFWGEPRLLFETVTSVLRQDDPDWRLLVLDDGYPDDSVAPWFEAVQDSRVQYRRNERNLGIVENFRASVEAAEAEYLVVLGSDDLLHPGYVRAVHARIERHPDADIFQPGVVVVDGEGQPSEPPVDWVKQRILRPKATHGDVVLQGEALASSLLRGNWLYWPSLVFRTAAIRRHDFRDDLPVILDLAIILDIVFDGGSLVAMPETVFSYRRHGASASQRSLLDGSRFADDRRFFDEAATRSREAGWRKAARAARIRVFARLHAFTQLPAVLRRGTQAGRRSALRHIFGG
ncbi:glycosyltransferase family 2 protein [Microbacterium esteraromaticum]|uniref:glycosyltransferase family 2 protein n=1 Tax=Microbacterium esteraromaticum TaxID=57043 RepID=UPI000B34C583|nr:glycosyltransferase family 2 protein [Microbacterium esteraromaticum]